MSEKRITGRVFHDAEGVQDWRVLYWGAYSFYRTGSFAEGARFVAAIAEVSDATGHAPDVDLRPEGVTVRTFSREDGALSERDVEFARRISVVARELGLEPDPSQHRLSASPSPRTPISTYDRSEPPLSGPIISVPRMRSTHTRRNPHLWFHELNPPKPGRGRIHIDVSVPADQAEARVAAALAAGGRIADDSRVPEWWTLASPNNHGVDIAAWPDFEDYDDG